MNFQRLRWGEWIAGIAGLDLALVTFRSWYKITGAGTRITAWDALTTGRYLLIATAVVGVFLLLIQASEQTAELSFPPGAIAAVVGLGCTVYVAYRLASPPADNLDADIGIYFGLAGAIGVAVGGLLSMREGPVSAYAGPVAAAATAPTEPAWEGGATTPPEFGGPAPAATWSPAAPAPAGETWSPAAPAAPPPATAAGQAAAAGGVQAGDEVRLTAGGTRFPAGTIARVVQVFGGGALVEVTAPDGVSERFEVPEAAYEPAGAGPATGVAEPPSEATTPSTAGESWSPAMPAPAEAGRPAEDWGFGEPDDGVAAEKKVPWYKREIGGKKKDEDAGTAETAGLAVGAAAAGAAAAEVAKDEEARPGFFKRLFGGGKLAAEEAEQADGWTVPGEAEATPEAEAAAEPEAAAPEPVTPEPEVAAEPEPVPPAPEPEPEAAAPEPEPVPEPEPPAPEPEPEPPAPEPEPEAAAPEPEPEAAAPAPEPEPEPPAAPEPEPEPPAPEPEAAAPEPEPPAPEPEPEAAAPEPAEEKPADEAPKKRRRSSGSRKVPKKALEAVASEGGAPKVGDQVELKVAGGRWDAGTRGTVVDVFSAGVIVEVADDDGKTERLDLPFEAVGPAAGA